MKIAIVDLGCGNIGAVGYAFERLGLRAEVTHDPDTIRDADRIVLPGVGAARFAMERIEGLGLADLLRGLRQPVLGICLGMQLLFDRSEEQDSAGLGIIGGEVRKLQPAPDRPVPHMGWSRLSLPESFLGLRDGDYVYFAHSFAAPAGPSCVATVDHGGAIAAIVQARNFTGVQFHPERSGPAGARLLEAFVRS